MRIGEVATATGVTTKTLRYYEDIGLLPPPARQANGYRNYSPDTRTRVEFTTRVRTAALSPAIRRVLLDPRDPGQAPRSHLSVILDDQLTTLHAQMAAFTVLRATVALALQIATTVPPQGCVRNQICNYPLPHTGS